MVTNSAITVTANFTTTEFTNLTTEYIDSNQKWGMSEAIFITTTTFLLIQLLTGLVSNGLLVATICYSPSLKTPPNSHLVNICANNILLCVCVLCSFISSLLSITISEGDEQWSVLTTFGNIQMFISVACFIQYCAIFSAIGHYRCKTVKNPSMSVKSRSKVITKSIILGWTLSILTACLMAVSYAGTITSLSWNPFRKYIMYDSDKFILPNNSNQLKTHQVAMLYITLFIVILLVGIIFKSYYYIIKTLLRANSVCKNKVSPWERRTSSLSSDGNDLLGMSQRSYKPDESTDISQRPPFTVSNGQVLIDNFMVHYQKRKQSISFVEEALALENPLQAEAVKEFPSHKKKVLSSQLSNASQGSAMSGVRPDFTDISPGAELHRFQSIKNKRALQNQSLRRDRISLGGATKNSIVMISTFFLCSIPGVVCSIPGVLSTENMESFSFTLLFCQMIFYLNAPAYPIWYLVFSKRVRKCLLKLYDTAMIMVNLR